MFVVAVNEIFLLILPIKRTSVEEVLAFWAGLAGITGDVYIDRFKERSYSFSCTQQWL